MNPPRDHHWHTKFILKKFLMPGSPFPYVYDIEAGRFYDRKSPKSLCTQTDLLLVEGNEVTDDLRYGLETIWSKSIEDEAAPIIKALEHEDFGLSAWAKESLARFISLHVLRHPKMIKDTLEVEDNAAWNKYREIVFNDVLLKKLQNETGIVITSEEIQRFRDCFLTGTVEVKYKPARALKQLVKAHKPMSDDLAKMAWRICRASMDTAFITSDSPVIILPGKEPFGALLMPLSPKLMIEIFPEGKKAMTAYALFSKKKVRKANILTGLKAKKYIISHSKNLLENIVHRLKPRVPISNPH